MITNLSLRKRTGGICHGFRFRGLNSFQAPLYCTFCHFFCGFCFSNPSPRGEAPCPEGALGGEGNNFGDSRNSERPTQGDLKSCPLTRLFLVCCLQANNKASGRPLPKGEEINPLLPIPHTHKNLLYCPPQSRGRFWV